MAQVKKSLKARTLKIFVFTADNFQIGIP